jgi:3-methylcrotonyl-CoA carboxylase alpha subunit
MLVQAVGLAGGVWRLRMDGEEITARLRGAGGAFNLQQERSSLRLGVLFFGPVITVIAGGENYAFAVIDPCAPPAAAAAADTRLVAPIPARVAQLFVHAGMRVKKGEKLLILEAMKMETIFTAPRDGEIETVHVRQDELVQEGAQLVGFKPDAVPEG